MLEHCRTLVIVLTLSLAAVFGIGCDRNSSQKTEDEQAEAEQPDEANAEEASSASEETSDPENDSEKKGTAAKPGPEPDECRITAEYSEDVSDGSTRWSEGDQRGSIEAAVPGPREVEVYEHDDHGKYAALVPQLAADNLPAGRGPWTVPLWKVDCESPGETSKVAEQKHVDFSRAVVDWERDLMYATAEGGAAVLDLESGEVQKLTELSKRLEAPRGKNNCWGDQEYVPTDVPIYYDGHHSELVVKRGGKCGYERSWEFVLHRLALDDSGTGVDEARRAHLPTGLAKGPEQTLWLVDGAGATLRSGDYFEADGLLKSTDGGETWQRVETEGGEPDAEASGPVDTASSTSLSEHFPRMVIASQSEPGRLLVTSRPYSAGAAGSKGGELLYSDDGGQHWWKVPLAEQAMEADADRIGVWAIESPGESLEKLRIWTLPEERFRSCEAFAFGDSETPSCPRDALTLWTTDNGGDDWEKSNKTPAPPMPQRTLEVSDDTNLIIERASGRVVRKTGDEDSATTVFPTFD